MSVTFKIESFEGPLDLLLQLIEAEELDISLVSLASVAEQFVSYINENKNIPLEEVADFLVVAARLMYMKSKLLFPTLIDQELEDGPDLETQLKRYKAFVEASKRLDELWKSQSRSFVRSRRPIKQHEIRFLPPADLVSEVLKDAMHRIIARLEPLRDLPQTSIRRAVSIQDKIKSLFEKIRNQAKTTFQIFIGRRADKIEVIISFLALLELVKQRFVNVSQVAIFEDIEIEEHPDAPESHPLAESYV
ncbi:MAG: segregation/condensation protein A [Patescibacteria group bacterium]